VSDESTRFFVGRGGRWVPDPLNATIRASLGEERARELDDLATLAGEDVPGWPDGVLESQPEPFADFDPQQAAGSLAWELRTDEAWDKTFQAEEEVAVLQGLLRTDPSPELERRLREANRYAEELEASREGLYDEMEKAGGFYLRDTVEAYLHLPYDRQPAKALVLGIAMAREWAIRNPTPAQVEAAAAASIVDAAAVEPVRQYREVGTGNVAEILERQRAAKARTYGYVRRDVMAPRWLAEQRRRLGDQRYETMATRADPLARRLERQPEDWVHKRTVALGPADQNFPRDAAMHERRLAYALANARLERDLASEEAERQTDAELAAMAQRTADFTQGTIDRLERELAPHRDRLDAWMNSPDTLRRIAYADEVARRHAVNVAQHVALARDDTPQHLLDLIGPPDRDSPGRNVAEHISQQGETVAQHLARARDDPHQDLYDFFALPDPAPPERASWNDIARRVEDLRLSGQFDPHPGSSAQSLAEQLPGELQSDIDDLRERIGIEPLKATTPHVAVQRADLEIA
jgi:hypothetical protein